MYVLSVHLTNDGQTDEQKVKTPPNVPTQREAHTDEQQKRHDPTKVMTLWDDAKLQDNTQYVKLSDRCPSKTKKPKGSVLRLLAWSNKVINSILHSDSDTDPNYNEEDEQVDIQRTHRKQQQQKS